MYALRHRKDADQPLDEAALEALAIRYAGRYATSRGRLSQYLCRKLRERGQPDMQIVVAAIAERLVERGYVDDQVFAEGRTRAMLGRGLGPRRINALLRTSGVDAEVAASISPDALALHEAADRFARRRRIGPHAASIADTADKRRQLAAMIKAGHSFELARRFVDAPTGAKLDPE